MSKEITRCKKCFKPLTLDSDSQGGFCGYHAKVLTGEQIRMENEWERLMNGIRIRQKNNLNI